MQEEYKKVADLASVAEFALLPNYIDDDELNELLEPVKNKLSKFDVEVQLVGLEETEKELKQLDIIFEEIRKKELSPAQIVHIDELEKKTKALVRLFSELTIADDAAEAVKKLDVAIVDLQARLRVSGADTLAKSLAEIEKQERKVIEETKATGDALLEVEERFRSLRGLTVSLRLDEFKQRLEDARIKLVEVGQTDVEKNISAINREFEKLSKILVGQPEKLREVTRILDDLKRTEVEIKFKAEVKGLRKEVENVAIELELLGRGPAEKAVREINARFRILRRELGLNETQAKELRNELDALARANVKIEIGSNIQETREEIRELRNEIQNAFLLDEADRRASEVNQGLRRTLDDLRAAGELTPEIEANLTINAQDLKDKIREAADVEEFAELVNTVSESIFKGIVEGFIKGEKPSKVWAALSAEIFADALEKTLKDLANKITKALGGIFESLGAGTGFLGSLGGAATALMGMAGIVLQSLEARSTSELDEAEDKVTSSEAVRGVVAGPTNVAIAEVNEGLKNALRTTEILLERIAAAVEGGSGGPSGGGRIGMRNSAYPLTGSTAS